MVNATVAKQAITEQQEDAITSLRITVASDFERFNICIAEMNGALTGDNFLARQRAYYKYHEALQRLDAIEDAIKRFREGKKQKFEED